MIHPAFFCECLAIAGITFYTGVPDSLLKSLCAYLDDNFDAAHHIISSNEGSAIGIAAGHYLATGCPAVVYMQNSGFGNALNPLLSLADPDVYGIPMLLLIGWRGEPNSPDEPQHVKQGRIQTALLEAAEIPYQIIEGNEDISKVLEDLPLVDRPVALLIKKGSFAEYSCSSQLCEATMLREEALEIILSMVGEHTFISTTGKSSRELYELRVARHEYPRDFLTVGSMGHSSSIALGIALAAKEKKVICLDGDGAMLMHLGTLSTIGQLAPPNYIHILLNNGCHESVGGQATAAKGIDFASLVRAMGYKHYLMAHDSSSLKQALEQITTHEGPLFLEIKLKPGSRKNLGRPTSSPKQNKEMFMEHLEIHLSKV